MIGVTAYTDEKARMYRRRIAKHWSSSAGMQRLSANELPSPTSNCVKLSAIVSADHI